MGRIIRVDADPNTPTKVTVQTKYNLVGVFDYPSVELSLLRCVEYPFFKFLETGQRWALPASGDLGVGDLVMSLFQDVTYDDGTYEHNIPYRERHKHLLFLERGTDDPNWMDGLKMTIQLVPGRPVEAGTIIMKSHSRRPRIRLGDGRVVAVGYEAVATSLFDCQEDNHGKKPQQARKFWTWPR